MHAYISEHIYCSAAFCCVHIGALQLLKCIYVLMDTLMSMHIVLHIMN